VIPIYEELLTHFEQLRQQYPVNEALLQQSDHQKHREKHRQSELTFNSSIANASQHVETQSSVAAEQITFEHHLSTNIRAGWQKLENYYSKLDDSPVYVAAIVLRPHMKWRWLEKSWLAHPEWIDPAKIKFTKLTQRYQHVGGVAAPPDVNSVGHRRVDSEDDISDDEEDEHAAGTHEGEHLRFRGERIGLFGAFGRGKRPNRSVIVSLFRLLLVWWLLSTSECSMVDLRDMFRIVKSFDDPYVVGAGQCGRRSLSRYEK